MINNEPTYLTLINWQVDWLAVVVSTRNEVLAQLLARPELTDWLLDCDGTNWIFNLKTGDEKWAHIERADEVHTLLLYSPHQQPGCWRVSEERLAPRTTLCLWGSMVRLFFIIITIIIMLGLGLVYQPRQASLDLKYRRCSEKMMMRLKHLQNWMWLIGSTLV